MVKFVTSNPKVADFLRMNRLLGYLESDAPKANKIREIKAAREDGFLTEDEAIELAIEFC